jgi:hypothetical protein
MGMDLDWMRVCTVVCAYGELRDGTRADVDAAADMGKPVFLSLDEFLLMRDQLQLGR